MLVILSLPITFVLILIFPFYKIRLVGLFSDRIGHYAMNTELLLCYLDKIRSTERRVKYLFYTRDAPICNEQLHKMWKRTICILPMTKLAGFVDRSMFAILKSRYKNRELKRFETPNGYQDLNGRLRNHVSHLQFHSEEEKCGKMLLSELGIPVNARFICILARDAAYLKKHFPNNDWSYHSYRDCDIENFKKAATYLANKGYYVLRMGKNVIKSFAINHPNIIDYANHSLRSDFLDIYLSAHCTFFISTATGLDAVPQIFKRPVLLTNIAPFNQQLQYWYPCEFFVTKKIFDYKKNKFLSLKEIENVVAQTQNFQNKFKELNWYITENSDEEILDAVKEMEEKVISEGGREIKNNFYEFVTGKLPFSMIADREWIRSHPEKFYIKMNTFFLEKNQFMFSE